MFFDFKGNVISEISLPQNSKLISYKAGFDSVVLSVCEGNNNCIIYVPAKDDVVTVKLDTLPVEYELFENSVYVLYNGAIEKYDIENGSYNVKVYECAPGANDILVTTSGGVYFCYSSHAIYYEF